MINRFGRNNKNINEETDNRYAPEDPIDIDSETGHRLAYSDHADRPVSLKRPLEMTKPTKRRWAFPFNLFKKQTITKRHGGKKRKLRSNRIKLKVRN